MKKIAAAALLSIILITTTLLICAPNKAAEKTVVDENVINKTALSASTPAPSHGPPNSSQTQQPTSTRGTEQTQSTHYEEALPLPSPFIVAIFIIGLVAVFGLILSLFLRKRIKEGASHQIRMVTAHREMND